MRFDEPKNYAEANESRKMAEEDVQRCMQWLFQKQGEMENSNFGSCQSDVLEALKQQRKRDEEISQYSENIEKLLVKHQLQGRDSRELKDTYDSVKEVSSKRSSCMEILSGIANLEDLIENLATEFDARAVHLVNAADNNKPTPGESHLQSNESMAKASQNCVISVRNNWRWISAVLQCAQVHLHNAAAYQQLWQECQPLLVIQSSISAAYELRHFFINVKYWKFFHEVEEVEYWMNITLSRIHLTFDRSKLKGDKADAKLIHDEIKDVLLAYLQWQGKVESLFERAKSVVPVPNRLYKLEEERPVVALTDFRSSEIEFKEGETLTLLDNSDRTQWMVKNAREQTSIVPAVVLLMPAPSAAAVDAAIKLRVQLLSLWTMSIKRLGYQMITFMLYVFRDWTEEERKGLRDMEQSEKEHLLRSMNHIETTLEKNWEGYDDFNRLKTRMINLRNVLQEVGDIKGASSKNMTAVVQIRSLENLLNKYKDFWAFWETFKVIVELVREPKHLLVCDKWDELRYVTTAHFVKFWDVSLDIKASSDDVPDASRNGETSHMMNGYSTESNLGPGSTVTSDSTINMLNGESISTPNMSAIMFYETPKEPLSTRSSQEDRVDYKQNQMEVDESMTKTDMAVEESMVSVTAPKAESTVKNAKTSDDETWKSTSEEWGIITETITTNNVTSGYEGGKSVDEDIVQETIVKRDSGKVESAMEQEESSTEYMDLETRTTTVTTTTGEEKSQEEEEEVWETVEETVTEDVQSSTVVEARTLELTEAKDTRTGQFIDFSEAANLGIIDFEAKEFVDMQTMKRMPFGQAVNEGLINFELRSKKTLKKEDKTYGLMTIRSTKDNRPFTIQKVLDPATEEEMTVAEAYDRGILDRDKNRYITEAGDSMSILDAIHSGLIKADFKEIDGAQESTEIVEKTYAVYGVVNQRTKSTVSFSEAIELKILDCSEGLYVQNVDNNKIPISEAIMKGFIKARFVTDPSKLDGDPSANVVVERLANTKSKILRAVRAARAFKMATN